MDEYEYAMLQDLVQRWQCSISEAIRRAIVYTYAKFVGSGVGVTEEELERALQIALFSVKRKASEKLKF